MSRLFNKTIYASKGGNTETRLQAGSVEIPSCLELEGKFDITAASADDNENTLPAFHLVANTGQPMELDGFFWPVVISIKGAQFDKRVTPVIKDHDTSQRIGHTTKQSKLAEGKTRKFGNEEIQGPAILAEGVVSSKMAVARGFVEDARAGFPFQVSVGAKILQASFVEEGEKAEVNGQTFKGPFIHAEKTSIRELTITVLGADNDTSARIAAQFLSRKEDTMNFESWVQAMGFVLADLTDAQKTGLKAQYDRQSTGTPGNNDLPSDTNNTTPNTAQASAGSNNQTAGQQNQDVQAGQAGQAGNDGAALLDGFLKNMNAQVATNQARIDSINNLFANHSSVAKVTVDGKEITASAYKQQAISSNLNPDAVELTLLKASYPGSSGSSGPAFHMVPQAPELSAGAISCALVRQSGKTPASREQKWSGEKYGYEHSYTQEELEASDNPHIRNMSLHQLFDMVIHAAGHSFHGNRRSDNFIRATRDAMMAIKANASASTSLDISNIFEDSANKMMLAAYQAVDTTWQEIAAVTSVSDFKTHNMYRLVSKGSYQVVGTDGELRHGGFAEQKYTIAADTYGKIVGMDRKKLINDDLNAFSQIMTMLGVEAAKALEELVYVNWLGQLGTFYTAGLKNYISGAATDLTIAGMTTMLTLFGNQVDEDTAPLLFTPDRILVGTQDRVIAGQLHANTSIRPVGSTQDERFTDNPHVGALRPIVTPYLNNTSIKQRVDIDSLGSAIPGQSSDQWFTFVDPNSPMGASINVALLNGNRTPVLESADAQFDMLGMRWRGYHDFGTDVGDPKLSAMSKGAA